MEGITTSSGTKNIMEAIFQARAEMNPARKDASNDRFASRYATLNSVLAAIEKPLANQGILLIQLPVPSQRENHATVVTELRHIASGEYLSCVTEIPMSKSDAQGMGSAITYARRYALTAILGIPTEDDDGNAASLPPVNRGGQLSSLRQDMWNALRKVCGNDNTAMRERIQDIIGHAIVNSQELTPEEMRMVTTALKN